MHVRSRFVFLTIFLFAAFNAAEFTRRSNDHFRSRIYQGALTLKMRSLPRASSTHSRSRAR